MTVFKCPFCQGNMEGHDDLAGQVVICPFCKNGFQMPGDAPPAPLPCPISPGRLAEYPRPVRRRRSPSKAPVLIAVVATLLLCTIVAVGLLSKGALGPISSKNPSRSGDRTAVTPAPRTKAYKIASTQSKEDETVASPISEQAEVRTKGGDQHEERRINAEQVAVDAFERGIKAFEASVEHSNKYITGLKYNVERSSSLLYPYTGTLSYKSCENKNTLFDNPVSWYEHNDTFGWKNGLWVPVQRQLRKAAYGGPFRDAQHPDFKYVSRPGYVQDDLFKLQEEAFRTVRVQDTDSQ